MPAHLRNKDHGWGTADHYKGTAWGDTNIVYTPVDANAEVTHVAHLRVFPAASATL